MRRGWRRRLALNTRRPAESLSTRRWSRPSSKSLLHAFGCLPGDAREQFNTADPRDTLNDRVRPGIDTRLGVLSPNDGKLGSAAVSLAEDGSVTMTTTFRYPALRNLRDPWKSDLPNTFLEPYHFHIEFEVLPEGVEPLDPDRDRIEHIDGESN